MAHSLDIAALNHMVEETFKVMPQKRRVILLEILVNITICNFLILAVSCIHNTSLKFFLFY